MRLFNFRTFKVFSVNTEMIPRELIKKEIHRLEREGLQAAQKGKQCKKETDNIVKGYKDKAEDAQTATKLLIDEKEGQLKNLQLKIGEPKKVRKARHESYVEADKKEKLDNFEAELLEKLKILDEQEKVLDQCDLDEQEYHQNHDSCPKEYKITDNPVAYYSSIAVIGTAEFFLIQGPLRDCGLDENVVYSLSFILPGIIAVSGEILGSSLSKEKFKTAAISALLGITSLATTYYYRVQSNDLNVKEYIIERKDEPHQDALVLNEEDFVNEVFESSNLENEQNEIVSSEDRNRFISAIPLTVMNLALYGIIIIFSFHYHSRRPYWLIKKREKEASSTKRECLAFINNQKTYRKDIEKEFEDEANLNVEQELFDLNKEKESLSGTIRAERLILVQVKEAYERLASQAVSAFSKGFNKFIKKTPRNPFPVVIGLMMFLGTACSDLDTESTPVKIYGNGGVHIIAPVDKSESMTTHPNEAQNFVNYLKNKTGLNDGSVSFDEFTIILTSIEGIASSPYYEFHLPKMPFGKRNYLNREKEIHRLFNNVLDRAEIIFNTPDTASESHISEMLAYHLNKLKASPASNKELILYSDGILDNNYYISFEDYQGKLGEFQDNFQQIRDTLQLKDPIREIDGIQITIVHHTYDEKWERLSYVSKNFWDYYLELEGAQVELLPNLN